MQKRSSKAHLVSVVGRLKNIHTHVELRAYQRSGEYVRALIAMDLDQQVSALDSMARAWVRCTAKSPLPARGTVRVKAWDAPMIAKLRDAAKHHSTDDGIARALGIPLKAAKRARQRYVGSRVAKPAQSVGVAATMA